MGLFYSKGLKCLRKKAKAVAEKAADPQVTVCPPRFCDGYRDHTWIKPQQEKEFQAAEDYHSRIHWVLKLNRNRPHG